MDSKAKPDDSCSSAIKNGIVDTKVAKTPNTHKTISCPFEILYII